MAFLGIKDPQKLQKANEGHEGQIKGQRVSKTKFQIFSHIFVFLGSLSLHDFHIFEFRGH